ncbi:hypothetical protein R0131_10715 [Clostridium sp. AL.422]|uniref:hypothetical protein n=1 Tax=Clostridium TaxID=1485 RepID=UPI00293DD155|nr:MULTISPECIES: hypothetical protein [unclassified Clostridium]MDV4151314.1 hypothetical protein [Clostridium sp. AL.422]
MKKSKILKALILGISMSVMSSTLVLADENGQIEPAYVGQGTEPASSAQQTEPISVDDGKIVDNNNQSNGTVTDAPDSSVSIQAINEDIDENILNKQQEINVSLFEQHKDEISQRGFQITHTVPFKDYVEIGILPYSDENANYLYEILGRDMVNIIEGQEVMIMGGQEQDQDAELYIATTTVQEDAEKTNNFTIPLLIVGVCVLGGVAILSTRKKVNYKR